MKDSGSLPLIWAVLQAIQGGPHKICTKNDDIIHIIEWYPIPNPVLNIDIAYVDVNSKYWKVVSGYIYFWRALYYIGWEYWGKDMKAYLGGGGILAPYIFHWTIPQLRNEKYPLYMFFFGLILYIWSKILPLSLNDHKYYFPPKRPFRWMYMYMYM